jgi:CheY-like chemotaxis protein
MLEEQVDNKYIDLVNKAYIEPIKSVLAIDDQYQSLDNILDCLKSGTPLTQNAELTRQIETLNMVRSNNWLADMHNGQTDPDSTIFDRLHQCDLLLLDYHLEKNDQDDPEKALHILSTLNKNNHFNLVIVYTAADNLKKVRTEIFIKLSSRNQKLLNAQTDTAEKLLSKWDDDGESHKFDMLSKITRSDLELILTAPSIMNDTTEFTAVFSGVDLVLNTITEVISHDVKKQIYIKLIQIKIDELVLNGDFSGNSSIQINHNKSHTTWIKTDKLFIAIISKEKVPPKNLLETLTNSLVDWRPTCHRLFLSKIKSELDDHGQTFEEEVLKCKYTNAGWLKQFAENSNNNGMKVTISRLMQGLTSSVNNSSTLNSFSSEIHGHITSTGVANIIKLETNNKVNIENETDKIKILKHLNAHIGTQDIEGEHLMTGHIIEWYDSKTRKIQYLLCLTPACDLEPGRTINKGWKSDLTPFLPVKVIRLIKQENNKDKKSLQEITKKPIIFLNIDNEVICFKAADDGKSVFDEQVFANNEGKFEFLYDLKTVEIQRTILTGRELTTEIKQCRVIGHLRYEYALNLLQRLGQDLTKIGLDYVSF